MERRIALIPERTWETPTCLVPRYPLFVWCFGGAKRSTVKEIGECQIDMNYSYRLVYIFCVFEDGFKLVDGSPMSTDDYHHHMDYDVYKRHGFKVHFPPVQDGF